MVALEEAFGDDDEPARYLQAWESFMTYDINDPRVIQWKYMISIVR